MFLLIELGGRSEIAKKDVGVAEVAVCATLRRLVTKHFGNQQTLHANTQTHTHKYTHRHSYMCFMCKYTHRQAHLSVNRLHLHDSGA